MLSLKSLRNIQEGMERIQLDTQVWSSEERSRKEMQIWELLVYKGWDYLSEDYKWEEKVTYNFSFEKF